MLKCGFLELKSTLTLIYFGLSACSIWRTCWQLREYEEMKKNANTNKIKFMKLSPRMLNFYLNVIKPWQRSKKKTISPTLSQRWWCPYDYHSTGTVSWYWREKLQSSRWDFHFTFWYLKAALYCQAQPKPQINWAIFSANPTAPPPPTWESLFSRFK